MFVNSSSSLSTFLPPLPPLLSPNSSLSSAFSSCFSSVTGNYVFTAFTFTNILLVLPLSIFVLHLGCQRRRQRCTMGHCEVITYHITVMEMWNILGSLTFCVGHFIDQNWVKLVGSYLFFITSCGQVMFHVLTCVERYLAVVHPVAYLKLRKGGGLRLRNATIWAVWLLSLAEMGLMAVDSTDVSVTVYLSVEAFSLVVIFLCSLSVLRALKRPGPGEGSRDRERVDPSKQRAFYTILAVMGPLMLRCGGSAASAVLFSFLQIETSKRCGLIESGTWFSLPSSLVLPLLFLHRAGKLPRCSRR